MDRRDHGSSRNPYNRGMLTVLAFQAFTKFYSLHRKPLVTAAILAGNTVIYLRPGVLHYILPHIDEVWFNPHLILKHRDLKRFILSAFYHLNEPHLVYNMMSLLWKGAKLENSMGSVKFASMVATLLCMSQGITLVLSKLLLVLFDYERPYYFEYSVGFSGVLFAMKVVQNSQSGGYTSVHGLIMPMRFAAWAELILIQILVPNVSFIGHLGGILAGILYLRFKAYSCRRLGRGIAYVMGWCLRRIRCLFRFQRGHILGQRRWDTPAMWTCQACTYNNSEQLSVCEMCGTCRSEGNATTLLSTNQFRELSLEEVRNRRIERFER